MSRDQGAFPRGDSPAAFPFFVRSMKVPAFHSIPTATTREAPRSNQRFLWLLPDWLQHLLTCCPKQPNIFYGCFRGGMGMR
jgi:hypothetical protein